MVLIVEDGAVVAGAEALGTVAYKGRLSLLGDLPFSLTYLWRRQHNSSSRLR